MYCLGRMQHSVDICLNCKLHPDEYKRFFCVHGTLAFVPKLSHQQKHVPSAKQQYELFLYTAAIMFKRVLGKNPPEKIPPEKIHPKKNVASFIVATLFRFVARFARVRIEDSSRNRFALNGIQGIACFIVFSS